MPSAKRNKSFWIVGILLAILMLGWNVAWLAASMMSDRYLNAWIGREKQAGREWSCKERKTSGWPTSFGFTCKDALMLSQQRGGQQKLNLQGVSVFYSLSSPRSAKINLTGPLIFEDTAGSQSISARWENLGIELNYPWPSPPTATATARNFQVSSNSAGSEQAIILASSLNLKLRVNEKQGSPRSLSINLDGDGIASRALDEALANPAPTKLNAVLDVSHFEHLLRGDMRTRLASWQQTGGSLNIIEFKSSKGAIALEAEGRINLDTLRRPAGNLNVRAAGMGAIFQRFGLPGASSGRPGLLGGLLRKPAAPPEAAEQPGRFIPLPLGLRDGAVWLGPLKTPIALRPLF
jgi:hypothetical protein